MASEIEGLYDNKISKGKGLCRQISEKEREKKSELIRNKFSFISSFRDSAIYIFGSYFLYTSRPWLEFKVKRKSKNEIKISHLVSLLFWYFKRKIGGRKTKIFFYFNFSIFLYFNFIISLETETILRIARFYSEILSTSLWNIYIQIWN